jgi:hypothetical protein
MGRKRKQEGEKKVNITLRLKKSVVDRLRKIRGYNNIVEMLIEEFLERLDR